ncbi:MAG TPA: glycosyltransferase family 1 protein [Acidimicrobiales bacterium]
MLTVAVDATPLAGDRTGIGRAVSGLVRKLAARDDLTLVGYGLTAGGWHRVREALPEGSKPARGPMPAAALLRVWARADMPPVELWTGDIDVVHGTNYVVPPARNAARLVSVWDLTAVRYPELCTATSRRYPQLVERAIGQGAWVHTGACSVAREIVDHFGVEPSRVRVIPPGLDPPAAVSTGGQGGPPYILGLGRTEPRKDFPGLVSAFDRIASSHPDLQLWIAGPAGWGEDDLDAAIRSSPNRAKIKRLGWVSDASTLVSRAEVFAYPSIYEGFGYPPLEAMSFGVPVVATSAGALPEVAGDAVVMVEPGDTDALAGALARVLGDEGLRQQLVEKGKNRVARFTWDAAASATRALYEEIAGSR